MNEKPETVAEIGENTIVEPGVVVGYKYHKDAGGAKIGTNGILRMGTIIYGDVSAGDYFQTGHHVIIRAQVKIGDYCNINNQSTLEGIVRMGDGVRIMAHVYIPSRTWFGDHIFVGPGVNFLNDMKPGRWPDGAPEPRGAFVEDDVTIGGGCTILPGIQIGKGSFIAAGAVVIKDVPERTLVVGTPGRNQPLPASLDRENDRTLTIQPLDIWHPLIPDLSIWKFPPYWPQENQEAAEGAASS
ncbi:MAG: acyltransferase [Verrucomicrobiota bacterium]